MTANAVISQDARQAPGSISILYREAFLPMHEQGLVCHVILDYCVPHGHACITVKKLNRHSSSPRDVLILHKH